MAHGYGSKWRWQHIQMVIYEEKDAEMAMNEDGEKSI